MQKILTVVVPVYNVEKYLKRCLDSILIDSILNNLEVIVVNDGSKDNSIDIVREYEKRYPNTIIVIDKENGGHGSTINSALKIASGKYFRVIDSDDWVNSRDFEIFVGKIQDIDCDLIITNYRKEYVYQGESELLTYPKLLEGKTYKFDKFDLQDLMGEYFVMANSTYKTSLLKESKVHLFEKTFYVDMQYNTEAIKNVKEFVYLDLDIYRYYIGRKDQSMNMDNFVKNKQSHDRVMRFLIEDYVQNKKGYSSNKQKYLQMIISYMLYTHYSIYCIYDKDKRKAISEIRDFDKYLFSKDEELYNKIGEYELIRFNRKYNFYPCFINRTLLDYMKLLYKRIIKHIK